MGSSESFTVYFTVSDSKFCNDNALRKIIIRLTSRITFEVFPSVNPKMAAVWVVPPCNLVNVYWRFRSTYSLQHRSDDRGSKDLWNVGLTLSYYMTLQPRRHPSSYSLTQNVCIHTMVMHVIVFVNLLGTTYMTVEEEIMMNRSYIWGWNYFITMLG